jgi:hypothetical protein
MMSAEVRIAHFSLQSTRRLSAHQTTLLALRRRRRRMKTLTMMMRQMMMPGTKAGSAR